MDKLVVFTVLFTLTLITIKIQIFFVPIILFLGMKKLPCCSKVAEKK